MLTDLAIVFFTIAILILFVASVRAPRWCSSGSIRFRMWRLRDDVVDDGIAGRLPANEIAVMALVEHMEHTLREHARTSIIEAYLSYQSTNANPSANDLTEQEQARLFSYRQSFHNLYFEELLLSSWLGIFIVLYFLPRTLLHRFRVKEFAPTAELKLAGREAVALVATRTRLGQRVYAFTAGGHESALS